MGTFAETAIVDDSLSFADQEKQTSVFHFRLRQTNGSLSLSFSVYIHTYMYKYFYGKWKKMAVIRLQWTKRTFLTIYATIYVRSNEEVNFHLSLDSSDILSKKRLVDRNLNVE
jgi:hypothetical protein